jgi:glycosyltransferase involved in cell wall biosynthesis
MSLLQQDFAGKFEVIVVDDGSTDETVSNLQTIKDERLRVISQANKGAAEARKNGIEHAKAEVVIFNDSDDIAYPNKIDVLYSALINNPRCILAFAILENKVKRTGRLPTWAQSLNGETLVFEQPLDHFFKNYYPIASAMNLAVRTKYAIEAAQNNSYFKAANDYHYQFKLAGKGPFIGVAKITGEYHVGEGISSIHGVYSQDAYSIISLIQNYLRLNKPKEYANNVRNRVENETPKVLIPLFLNHKFALLMKVIKIMFIYGRWVKIPTRIWWAFSTHIGNK